MSRSAIVADIQKVVSDFPEARRAELIKAIGGPLVNGTYGSVDVPREGVTIIGVVIGGSRMEAPGISGRTSSWPMMANATKSSAKLAT